MTDDPKKRSDRVDPATRHGLNENNNSVFDHQSLEWQAEHQSVQKLISAAILTTTAFRLSDRAALIDALRLLAEAVQPFQGDLNTN